MSDDSEAQLNIPDEAWRGVLDFGIDGVLETVVAATPVIARAAQVAILRKVLDRYDNLPSDVRVNPIQLIEEELETLGVPDA